MDSFYLKMGFVVFFYNLRIVVRRGSKNHLIVDISDKIAIHSSHHALLFFKFKRRHAL